MENRERSPYPLDNPEIIELERRNFLAVISAFKLYRVCSLERVNRTERNLNALPTHHQEMLYRYRDNLSRIRDCIDQNYKIIKKLIKDVGNLFQNDKESTNIPTESNQTPRLKQQDLESVQIVLKQYARDWSSAGEEERQQCYKPIIDEITNYYSADKYDLKDVKILVPGAGLGRLTYELAYRGFYCEGNEWSLFMLMASNFVLNQCVIENQYTFYPFVHQYVNNLGRSDQVAPVSFPDVSPIQAPPTGTFNMVAGDFLEVYKELDFWDCVATCFFIDCAKNIVQFIESIFNILKPGAIWVNLGPLLYHWSNDATEGSIEPSYEDLILIIEKVGFEILKNVTGVRTMYAQNPKSMQRNEYESVLFVCRKPVDHASDDDSDEGRVEFDDDSHN